MDARSNFIETMDQLRAQSRSRLVNDVKLSSVPLRLLLLDDTPLFHRVNRDLRLKVMFRVGMHYGLGREKGGEHMVYASVGDAFDPETGFNAAMGLPVKEVALKEYLALPVVDLGGAMILTVRELVLHVAHVFGPAHGGPPETPKDERFLEWRKSWVVGGAPMGTRELAAIGRVTHRGLTPLYDAVKAGQGSPG